jgi:hypothetical protein
MCDWIDARKKRFLPTGTGETIMDTTARIGQRVAAHDVEIHDIRQRMPRGGVYPRFKLARWTHTAVHYTAAWRERSNLEAEIRSWIGHANYHVNTHGWPGIAYCIGITPSGRVLLLRDIEEMGYHAFNANEIALGISCDTTKGQTPTPDMLRSLNIVLKVLHEETPELPNLVRDKTYSHKELGFYDKRNYGTECCGDLLPFVVRYRKGEDFALSRPSERPQEVDCAKVDVPGVGERWVIGQIFRRWSEPKANVKIFGLPLTGMSGNDADGYQQIFERAIMRHVPGSWPEKHDVLLEHVGREVAQAKYGDLSSGPFAAIPAFESTDSSRYFPETNHSVSHGFKSYWEKYGDLDYFGLPISEEFTEDDQTVQYFERARFEWHPGSDPHHFDVMLGRLGAEVMQVRGMQPGKDGESPSTPPQISLDSHIAVDQPNDIDASQIVNACYQHNRQPKYERQKIERIAEAAVKRSAEFGFRTSIVVAQMLHETGFFQYGGQVKPEQNNYAGLGADNTGAAGASFPNEDEGVLAVVCHMALYVYGDIPQWPQHLQTYGPKATRRNAVAWAHDNVKKPDGTLLGYLGKVKLVRDYVNGRHAQTDKYPLGGIDNGYANSLVRVANEIIQAPKGSSR